MNNKPSNWIVALVTEITKDRNMAIRVVDALIEEGVITLSLSHQDSEKIVQLFSDTFGTTRTTRADSLAAARLTKKFGADAVASVIKTLGNKAGERYAPVVGSVAQLELKWVNVLNFLRNNRENEIIEL